ncbi:hypothetical protein RF11_07542 [Thelohanellus kitauei]|uniref:Uncharacterized protein n=1 Tax=Thelohanellus kitauei TaxID=669202 RepID=A0A0C2JCT1_THEKT|nr:hypothetical protein RF11_07542 [Thelohanellus kitauei]
MSNKNNGVKFRACTTAGLTWKSNSNSDIATHMPLEVVCNITKHRRSFSNGEFVKNLIIYRDDHVCPKHMNMFEEVSLSSRTVARHIEENDKDLISSLKELVHSFQLLSPVLY